MEPHAIIGLVIIGALLIGVALDAWLPGLPEKPATNKGDQHVPYR